MEKSPLLMKRGLLGTASSPPISYVDCSLTGHAKIGHDTGHDDSQFLQVIKRGDTYYQGVQSG